MADTTSARSGGFDVILSEAMPSVVASTAIFANVPAETRVVLLTLRGAGITMRLDGHVGAPTVGANGHDYGANAGVAPYEFTLTTDQAKRVRAVQNGGTATGWITYLKVA